MSQYERYLEAGGRVVGNAIGWGLRRMWDSFRTASENRKVDELLRPGDPNRSLPAWQMDMRERAVNKALSYVPDTVARAIKQPARQLCLELLLYDNTADSFD